MDSFLELEKNHEQLKTLQKRKPRRPKAQKEEKLKNVPITNYLKKTINVTLYLLWECTRAWQKGDIQYKWIVQMVV